MALNLKEVLIEEISLEGLDGITINALFLRLHERKGFTFKIDDSSKPYIWNCVLGLKDIDFFHLEQPRVELVPYNRFHYIDPETRHYLETDSIPDDIYHVKVIMEDGVLGSCSDYYTRTSVTDEVLTGKPSLQQALDKYGNSLVVVAVQETRVRTLLGPHNDPNVKFKAEVYTILEMIGRSRHNGIASYGKSSLLALKESTKTMYYFLKKLRRLNIVKKQRLVLVKKPSNMKVTCFLYHLDRFYVEVGNRQRQEIINMATYLSNKSECMEEVVKTKTDLKMFDLFKKVSQMTSRCGKRYFDFMDVPYREKFPHAKPREYLLKNHYTERKIRHVRLIMPLNEVLKCLKEPDQESDDDDDDEEEEDNEDVAPVPRLQFHRVLDQPQLYQTMQLINAAGSKGLSLIQLKKLMNSHRLIIRRLIKILLKYGLITSIMEDRGRQKTVMYIAADVVTQNKIHKTVNEKMKQLQTIVMTPLKETIKGSRGIAAKEIPIIKFNNEVPTEEKVSEIIEELDKVTEAKPGVVSEKSLLLRREIMLQKQEESGVKVVVTEIFPEKFVEKRTGKEIKGMKRFGALLTESHVRRANWIMEVVSAIKVVVSFRMLKLLRNREKEMNLTICMDHKSLKRLTNALCEEGKIRLYKTVITMGEKTKEFLYLCDINVTTQDETLLRKLEEAKLLNFSVSKEELKNLNLKMAAREKLGKEQEKACHLPTSAMQTIKSHQEYRMKLMAKMPPMNFDRSAGKKYGLLPKMLRIRAVHKYLQYLCYTTHGNKMKSDGNLGNVSEKIGQLVKDKTTDTFDALNDQTDQEISADDTEHEPVVYVDEMSWKRYLPPIPVHSGYPKGWCLVSDCLLIMPVCFFCQIVNVSYQIDGLMETLNHPKKKFYPVINLPFKLTQQLLHAKKYVQSFLHLCGYMAEMGLLSYGREVLKEKEQTFVYLHHTGSLRDSRNSLPGYNKTTYPDGEPFLLKTFNFNDLNGVEEYWEFLQVVALNSSLGSKSLVQRDLDDEISYQERSIREATRTFMPDTVIDDGVIPGDGRGGAGLDSSLFSHTIKNWMYGSVSNASKYKYLPKKVGQDINLVSKREVVDQFNMNRIMGQDRLLLSENSDKPMALKKVRRENLKDNKGGKGQIRAKTTRVTNTHKIVQQQEGKIAKKRSIKFPQIKHRPVKKKAKEKGDEKDKMIYRERNKLRVGFTKKEDSVILMCWLANLIMNNRTSKVTLVPYITIRNYVHDKCGSVSFDKTSIAVQRRIKFVLKNPQTETNLLMFYREAMQDEFVLKTYVSKEYTATDENLVSDFRTLVDYLLEKFKSLDFKRCTLPENLDILRKNYTLQYIGKLKSKKVFTDAANKADVCRDVLRNILHSAVVLQDKQGRTHEMFKLLSQYPDALLCQVIKELRTDGLLVINKKNYQQEAIAQLHTGMGLRNFKVSQRYLYAFKHRYLSAMFDECASMVTQLCDIYLHGNGIDDMYTLPFAAKSGDCAALFPLLLHNMLDMRVTMPQELVIVDMEGFYNFPWGRGKSSSHNTKGDRVLQDIKGHSKDKTTEDKFEKKGKGVGKDDDKYIDESDDDSDIEMEALNKKGAAEKAETASKKLPSNTNYVSEAETVRKAVEDSTRVQVLSNENTCGNVQESEDVSEPNNCETETDKLEIVKDEVVDVTGETGDDFTILTTKNCNIIIPKADPIPETNIESCMMSAIASRTLISLRRAEDCSFDDIRIFNAQDNFVVNSCVIGIKIKDRTEEDNDENGMVKVEMKSKEDVEDAAVENPEVKATETTDTDKEDTNSQLCLDEKKQQLSPLVLSKEKIKNILKGMQRLVPFSLDVEQVWINMLTGGVTPHQLTMCKEIYHSIDSFGELGLRSYELKKECQDKDVWNQALEILLDQNLLEMKQNLLIGVIFMR